MVERGPEKAGVGGSIPSLGIRPPFRICGRSIQRKCRTSDWPKAVTAGFGIWSARVCWIPVSRHLRWPDIPLSSRHPVRTIPQPPRLHRSIAAALVTTARRMRFCATKGPPVRHAIPASLAANPELQSISVEKPHPFRGAASHLSEPPAERCNRPERSN